MNTKATIAFLKFKTGTQASIIDALLVLARKVDHEVGTTGYFIIQDLNDPDLFCFYERFINQEHSEIHENSSPVGLFYNTVKPHLEQETLLFCTETIAKNTVEQKPLKDLHVDSLILNLENKSNETLQGAFKTLQEAFNSNGDVLNIYLAEDESSDSINLYVQCATKDALHAYQKSQALKDFHKALSIKSKSHIIGKMLSEKNTGLQA